MCGLNKRAPDPLPPDQLKPAAGKWSGVLGSDQPPPPREKNVHASRHYGRSLDQTPAMAAM